MNNYYFFMRHGYAKSNETGIIACNPETAVNDYGLVDLGWRQARSSADQFSRLCSREPLVISSDLLRAYQTAQVIADTFGAELLQDVRLRERDFGELNDQPADKYQLVWESDRLGPDQSVFGCETIRGMVQRVFGLMSDLEQQHQDRTIVLVSHADTIVAANKHIVHNGFEGEVPYIGNAEIRAAGQPDSLIVPHVL